ncbi:MAG: hypothetical protein A2X13_02360 [Bacteroidetes bacterium GWC2_33_15]|nr:MAG: hypothetical protein A2X10_03350 [Bacteroidetes bacterium GWA2_33_15]OFX49618.1 MAG: hypothetical protein A2X13_02360 [Bacteroidetes bacterium GWC2_33_15]OFX66316.1 MAG: hypothetical protein A2X15_04830 [Bacteroidetes bacterium GWB2_32_14]OFX70105.1 MAG: hypothetical protein A2X14_01400 [Bacteroidetes bacterium GWD2_33_33]HAN17031.1 hypothetical protein [Bacteroidales bacterium]
MKPKYLYIDDESPEQLKSIVNGFNDIGLINVELVDLKNIIVFESLKSYIIKHKPDGLIIDLRLDGDGINRLDFPATTLAQDFRTSAVSTDLKPIPLVLCSTSSKIRATYDTDKSSHDLFDYKFEKSANPDWRKFSNKLKSLADTYKWLNEKSRSLEEIIGRKDWKLFDIRIFERFLDEEQKLNSNDIAQFIVKELFHHPGILVKERTVAARLGIDIEASVNEWDRLKKEILSDCLYTGAFSKGWERWWHDKVALKFQSISNGEKLQNLNAEQRVSYINKAGFKVNAAQPIKPYCKSTEFWSTCEFYKKPLDPFEGFRIFESVELKPWQEPKYLSFSAELERKGRDKGLRPHPSELDRIKDLKETLS